MSNASREEVRLRRALRGLGLFADVVVASGPPTALSLAEFAVAWATAQLAS